MLTETVLIPGPGALIKMPRISSQGKSPWCTLPVLEEMKAAFCRYEAPCLKLLFGPKFFGGTKSLISSASNHEYTARCLPGPSPMRSPGSLALCSTSLYRGLRGRSRGASGFNYLYRQEFSVLRPSFREVPALKSATLILVLLLPPS